MEQIDYKKVNEVLHKSIRQLEITNQRLYKELRELKKKFVQD